MLANHQRPETLKANEDCYSVLLTHSSGFGYDVFDPDLIQWREVTKSDLRSSSYTLEALRIPLRFQPGEGWLYGVGLDWAGYVVQILTGVPLEQYMQENICVPLGMDSTTFRMGERPELQHRRAEISSRSEPRGPLSPTAAFKPDTVELDYGGVGLYSTAADYAKLLGALVDDDKGILTAASVHQLCVPQLPDPKPLEAYFYGPMHYIFCPEYPKGLAINYALGGAVNLEDVPGKRRQGSIMWSGVTNPRWVSLSIQPLLVRWCWETMLTCDRSGLIRRAVSLQPCLFKTCLLAMLLCQSYMMSWRKWCINCSRDRTKSFELHLCSGTQCLKSAQAL